MQISLTDTARMWPGLSVVNKERPLHCANINFENEGAKDEKGKAREPDEQKDQSGD